MAGESRAGLSRRNVLRAFGGVAMVGLAGCSRSQTDPPSPTDGGGGEPGSVFQSLSFDLGDLVIGLPEDHGVSQISLVGPDGTVFTSVSPDFAATTVRLAVLDIRPGVGRSEHYTPGQHQIVAKIREETERRRLDLEPELSITNMELHREGTPQTDTGRVVFTIRNDGTGPTWIYDIVFENAPNWTVNDSLREPVGIPMNGTSSEDEVIIPPGEDRSYVSTSVPLIYDDEDGAERICNGDVVEFRAIVGTAVGPPLSSEIEVVSGGNPLPHGWLGSICSKSTIEVVDDN
jgi:hypothetical protein